MLANTRTHTIKHTYTHAHTRTRTQTHTNTRTHTHTHPVLSALSLSVSADEVCVGVLYCPDPAVRCFYFSRMGYKVMKYCNWSGWNSSWASDLQLTNLLNLWQRLCANSWRLDRQRERLTWFWLSGKTYRVPPWIGNKLILSNQYMLVKKDKPESEPASSLMPARPCLRLVVFLFCSCVHNFFFFFS